MPEGYSPYMEFKTSDSNFDFYIKSKLDKD